MDGMEHPPYSRSYNAPVLTRRTSWSRPTPPPGSMPPPPAATHKSTKAEPSHAEKLEAWVERIKLMSEAVSLRTEHLEMEKELQSYQRLASLWRFSEVSPDERAKFDSQITALEHKCEAKKKELNAIVFRLVDTDFWPVVPNAGDNASLQKQEIQANIQQLRNNIQELYGILRAVDSKNAVPPLPVKQEPEDVHPAKRPRLMRPQSPVPFPPMPSSSSIPSSSSTLTSGLSQLDLKEVEAVKEHLLKLEERLCDLEDNMVHHDNDLFMEMEDKINMKIEELETPNLIPNRSSKSDSGVAGLTSYASEKLHTLEHGLHKTEEEVGVVIEEVANIISGSNETQANLDALRQENAQLREQVQLLQQMQEDSKKAIERNQAELKSLSAAVSAYLSRSAETPSAPSLPSKEELMFSSYPIILQAIQEDLKPTIAELQNHIQNMLQAHSEELSTTVMSKLSMTLKTVETFSAWLENGKQNGVNGHTKPDIPHTMQHKQPAG
ncbi:unnamed protein product [Somion occarium]|uniref:Uncharacterized protein n=1 Tax=Somion occarium TaxID=3059160 RepID=A0ABP1DB03_9APHY